MPRHVPDLRSLGSVLRDLRKVNGLTQEQLSFKTGLTTALISDAENGKRNLSFESIDRILVALGVSWAEFGSAVMIHKFAGTKRDLAALRDLLAHATASNSRTRTRTR